MEKLDSNWSFAERCAKKKVGRASLQKFLGLYRHSWVARVLFHRYSARLYSFKRQTVFLRALHLAGEQKCRRIWSWEASARLKTSLLRLKSYLEIANKMRTFHVRVYYLLKMEKRRSDAE